MDARTKNAGHWAFPLDVEQQQAHFERVFAGERELGQVHGKIELQILDVGSGLKQIRRGEFFDEIFDFPAHLQRNQFIFVRYERMKVEWKSKMCGLLTSFWGS